MASNSKSSNNNRIKEFALTHEIKELGFTSARVIDKYLTLRHKSGGVIRCEFDSKNLPRLKKRLENAIAANEYGVEFDSNFDSRKFVIKFMNLLVENIEKEYEVQRVQEQQEKDEKQKILDDIERICQEQRNDNLTFQQWQLILQQKYQNLYDVVQEKMPEIWTGLEFELSILRILDIQGCTLPFIGIILGRPSSYKTVIIDLLKGWPRSFYTDNFTAKSFVSHSTSVNSPEELEEIDLLPKIKGKLFLTPELSPMFTTKEEDLTQLLGIITRIADGHGIVSDSGAHGHRGYDEEIMFTQVGAAVDIPYKVYKILGNLGAKLYFFRTNFKDETTDELLEYATVGQEFNDNKKCIKDVLFGYLKWFDVGFSLFKSEIKWDMTKDDKEALRYIVRLADLLSYLRCVAKVWETHDTQGSDYAYSISQREVPRRAVTALSNLARGHALLTGRNYITLEDILMILKTAMDTAQIERVSIFSLLLAYGGILTTNQIIDSLNISRPTALRTMAEFKAIGLAYMEDYHEEGQNNLSKRITLNPRFDWFLTDPMIKKIFPHTTHNLSNSKEYNNGGNGHAKKEDIFWRIYNELEKEESLIHIREEDKHTISGSKLKERLLLTGKFYDGDVNDMIAEMVKANKLEEVMLNTFRRISLETK